MTYEKTLQVYKEILGALERPDALKSHGEELLKWKESVIEDTLSRLDLKNNTRRYVKGLLERFYDALVGEEAESFWKGGYSSGTEDVLHDLSLDLRVFVIAEFLSSLSERIIRSMDKETAAALMSYLIRVGVSVLAFIASAQRDSEYDFLGISAELMDRIRKFGAGER